MDGYDEMEPHTYTLTTHQQQYDTLVLCWLGISKWILVFVTKVRHLSLFCAKFHDLGIFPAISWMISTITSQENLAIASPDGMINAAYGYLHYQTEYRCVAGNRHRISLTHQW